MALHVLHSKQHTTVDGRITERKEDNSKGFSLIELLVALVILSVSLLALISVILTSIQVNRQNDLRNTAIRLTGETAENLLAQPIDSITDGTTNSSVSVTIRTGTVPYTVRTVASTLSNDLKQINITVSYPFAGQSYSNQSVIYKHRAI